MKKFICSAAVLAALSAAPLFAQSANSQTKSKQQSGQTKTAGDKSAQQSTGSVSGSDATTGTPPTHINKKNTAPTSSNPQNNGVNEKDVKASSKKSGQTSGKKGGQ